MAVLLTTTGHYRGGLLLSAEGGYYYYSGVCRRGAKKGGEPTPLLGAVFLLLQLYSTIFLLELSNLVERGKEKNLEGCYKIKENVTSEGAGTDYWLLVTTDYYY